MGRAHSVQGPAGALAVTQAGQGEGAPAGPALLLVHGGGADRGHWAPLQARLSTPSLALDLRGHGASARAADARDGVQPAAEDVAAVADALLPTAPFVLVGHSFGASVALAYAQAHPQRVRALVLVDPPSDLRSLPEPQRAQLREGLRPDNFRRFTDTWFDALLVHARPATRAQVRESLHTTEPAVFTACYQSLLSFDPGAALAAYPGPRLALVCEALAGPDSLHRTLPRLPHRALAQVSHWPMLDAPDTLARELAHFLAALP